MDKVSPTRNKLRSTMVWARSSGWASRLLGRLKRQDSMPRFQSLQVNARSSTTPLPSPDGCGARALTKYAWL